MLLGLVPENSLMLSWFMWWVGDTLGVLVLFPLTMVVAGAPRPLWQKRTTTVAIPMLFAFFMLVVLYVNVSRWEQAESLIAFRLQSQRLADTIQARLDEQQSLLEQTQGLFAGNDEVTAEEFHLFTQQALKRYPMIQAIEWAPRVSGEFRDAFKRSNRRASLASGSRSVVLTSSCDLRLLGQLTTPSPMPNRWQVIRSLWGLIFCLRLTELRRLC